MELGTLVTLSPEEQARAIVEAAAYSAEVEYAKIHGLPRPQMLGYFFLMDENGNFIKSPEAASRDIPTSVDIKPAPLSEDLQRIQMVGRAMRNNPLPQAVDTHSLKGV